MIQRGWQSVNQTKRGCAHIFWEKNTGILSND